MGLKAGVVKSSSAGTKFRPPVGNWQAGRNQANTGSAVKQDSKTQIKGFKQRTETELAGLLKIQKKQKKKH